MEAGRATLDRRDLMCVVLLFSAVVLTFFPVVGHDFLMYDDPLNVTNNELLRRPLEWRRVVRFWIAPFEGLYAPASYTFYAVIVRGSELIGTVDSNGYLEAWPFHLANLILHATTCVVVYLLLRRFVVSQWAALAGGLLFALHPLQTESVAWVTETRGLLAGLFGMLALWQYVVFVQQTEETERSRKLKYGLATVSFLVAILCKPSVAAIPLMAGVLGIGLMQRPWKRVLLELAPWAALVVLVAWAAKSQQGPAHMAFEVPWLPRPWIALDALGFYLRKLFVPLAMGTDYGRDPLWVIEQRAFLLAGLAILSVVIAAALPHRRLWLVACGLFIAGCLPTLGLVSFSFQSYSSVADRFVYFAMLGPAFAAACLFSMVPCRVVFVVTLPIIAVLGYLAHQQAQTWENDEVMLRHTLSVNPTSMLALNNLGVLFKERGEFSQAEDFFRKAIATGSAHFQSYNGLGETLVEQGRFEEAIDAFQMALQKEPSELGVLHNLGQAELAAGRPQQAVMRFEHILSVFSDYVEVHVHLGQAYEQLNRPEIARKHYQYALSIEPTFSPALEALARLEERTRASQP